MSRMKKMLDGLQKELKNRQEKSQNAAEEPLQSPESLDVSSIEKASFLLGDQYSSHGNPLHSTALEDDCSPSVDNNQKATKGKKNGKNTKENARSESETPKRPPRVKKDLAKARRKGDAQVNQKHSQSKDDQRQSQQMQGPKPKKGHLQTISETREEARKKAAASQVSEDLTSHGSAEDASHNATPAHGQRRQSLSSEELTDEDESFHPSKEKHKRSRVRLERRPRSSSSHQQRGQKQKRKSSSGSSEDGNPPKKQKHGSLKNMIDLEVVLEAFREFVLEYKETVNSESVKQAIDALSRSFEEQLSEMITTTKEFGSVKRKAVKINGILNKKTTRLLEAKNELIKSEAEVRKLQKEHDELERRLKAVRQSAAFLTNLKELNKRYLQHRLAHPDEPETYGPSCMPAMLLEARSVMGTENQLKTINDKLQQVLDEAVHK